MKNIRAIACVMIIVGAILVEMSYRLMTALASEGQFRPVVIQYLIPALVGLILIHHGVKALLRPSSSN